MKIEILTIFPEIFDGFIQSSLIGKAVDKGLVEIKLLNFRDFASPPHFHVDDSPYGGGPGMVLLADPLVKAIENAKSRLPNAEVILLNPSGNRFSQAEASEIALKSELILICGRYEGVDQRVIDLCVDREVSIGDYVLMGGEVAAMVVIEAAVRLIPGVVGNECSLGSESFVANEEGELLLEAPQYSKPAEYRSMTVPPVLLSGNHAEVKKWRHEQAIQRTLARRPDLIK